MASRSGPFTPGAGPFAAAGVDHPSGNNRPFLLDGETAWIVREGHADVFAVELRDGLAVGARTHLARVGAGEALFGVPTFDAVREFGLLGVGANGSHLVRAPRTALASAVTHGDPLAEVADVVERWVEALSLGVARGIAPARATDLVAGCATRFDERTAVRPPAVVSWLRVRGGKARLFGRDVAQFAVDALTPIARRAWVEVDADAEVTVEDIRTVGTMDDLWCGLDRLATLVLACAAAAAGDDATIQRAREERRRSARAATLASACYGLAGIIEPSAARALASLVRPQEAHVDASLAALLSAARAVGSALGLEIKLPPAGQGASRPRDPLAAIARASRFRTRSVALRDVWWEEDAGPLLAYRVDGHQPVALLPATRRGRPGYDLYDPVTHTTSPVTVETADALAMLADSFYRPFPNRALGVGDVVRFGLYGCARDVRVIVLMSVAAALLGLVPAIVTGVIFNDVIPGAQRSQLAQLTAVLVVCAVSTAMFEVTRAVALLRIEGRMGNAVQSAVWDRLLALPTSFFRPFTAGELASRAMSIDGIRQVVSGTTVTALVGGVFSVTYFGLLFYYSASLALWATLLIATALAVSMLGSYLQLASQRQVYRLQGRATGTVLQLLSNVGKLRVANAEVQAFALWARQFGAQRRLQYRARSVANRVSSFNAAFPILANMLLFWVALDRIGKGETLRTGDFLAFMSAFVSCLTNVISTSSAILAGLNTIPMYEQAQPILEARAEVDESKADPGELSGAIEVQHAVFRYTADGPPVLRGINLSIRPGEFVAFVGASGSGKSTLLRILLGFESLTSGAVYYDGQDLASADVQVVRRQIGVVLQNGRLLSGDIFSNIVGSGLATMDDAWEAAAMAGFDEDVRAMPMGMSTVVSEGGGTLSGGQRQRMMIARAIVHRPRILLFDEATSALDNRTQAIVSASLERLQATRVVVAHRLSTIIKADRIFVVDRGEVVQQGTYEQLVRQPGQFADLASRQLA